MSARGISLPAIWSLARPIEMPHTTICSAGIDSSGRRIRWYFENVSCGHDWSPWPAAASSTFWMNMPRSSQLPTSRRRWIVTIRPTGAPKNA
ncbi:hypothetical protein ABIF65_003490 [Bradyrhizobium japonicum]